MCEVSMCLCVFRRLPRQAMHDDAIVEAANLEQSYTLSVQQLHKVSCSSFILRAASASCPSSCSMSSSCLCLPWYMLTNPPRGNTGVQWEHG